MPLSERSERASYSIHPSVRPSARPSVRPRKERKKEKERKIDTYCVYLVRCNKHLSVVKIENLLLLVIFVR